MRKLECLKRQKKRDNFKVAEAIRVPERANFYENKKSIISSAEHDTSRDLRGKMRKVLMEITGFKNSKEAVAFWQHILNIEGLKGKSMQLIKSSNPLDRSPPKLRVGKFSNKGIIFKTCRDIRGLNTKVLCYAVQDHTTESQ